jgi:hypothetical protein
MSEVVTLELPDHVVRSAQAVAARRHRRVEEILVDWIDQAAADVPVEGLSDEEILGLCDMQMADEDQEALNHLPARNRDVAPTRPVRGYLLTCRSAAGSYIRSAYCFTMRRAPKRGMVVRIASFTIWSQRLGILFASRS